MLSCSGVTPIEKLKARGKSWQIKDEVNSGSPMLNVDMRGVSWSRAQIVEGRNDERETLTRWVHNVNLQCFGPFRAE